MTFAHEWFRFERMMIGARCCGAADRLIEEVTSFAEQRMIGGEKLADHQAIQFMLADSLTELWGARLMVYETAREIDAGADVKMIHAHSFHGQAHRVRDGLPGGRPGRPDLRGPRLHAGERGREVPARTPGRPDLGGSL